MSECKVLGKSQIDGRNRITLVKIVKKILKVKPGEFIVFGEQNDGTICVHPYKLHKKPVNNNTQSKGEGTHGSSSSS